MGMLHSALSSPVLSATRLYHRLRPPDESVDVVAEDWDTLVILDGCRYDMFERLNTFPGTLEARLSKGSATDEFIRENFGDGTFHDIVYVTANPRVTTTFEGSFHAIVNVWEDGWDNDLQSVPPERVAEAALTALEEYPNKRIVAHFIQPHAPFIGEFAREHLSDHSTLSDHVPAVNDDNGATENVWTRLRNRDLDPNLIRRAYDENLGIVLPHVRTILESESGKTVVTSDHGNLLGERIPPFGRRFYGHPSRFPAEALLRVPWLEYDGGNRREIVAEPPADESDVDLDTEVEQKLKDLGYV